MASALLSYSATSSAVTAVIIRNLHASAHLPTTHRNNPTYARLSLLPAPFRSPPGPARLLPPLRLFGPVTEGGDFGKDDAGGVRNVVVRTGEALAMAFPVWIAMACMLGLWRPSIFAWADHTWQITGLTLTMLGMGMTLTLEDLKGAMLMPKELFIGFILQYTVMPLSGYLISRLLKLPSCYAAGLILVSCCPGGTASNIITFLARGSVALSVLMTAASTFSAVVMTPLLTSKLAGQYVAVDPIGLLASTVQVVLAPVLVGALLNQYCNALVQLVSPVMPLVAVVSVAILCGSAISRNAAAILSSGLQVVLACCMLHASGFLFGLRFQDCLGLIHPRREQFPLRSACRIQCLVWYLPGSILGIL